VVVAVVVVVVMMVHQAAVNCQLQEEINLKYGLFYIVKLCLTVLTNL
jgi:hypothetical protein